MNTYDLVEYPGRARAAAQCHRLEANAGLFGLRPATPASARVLELGCGRGENLAPQASAYPGARFIGCDSSAASVAAARELVRSLGLANVDLRCHDLREVDESWGEFDYILCHGVYSWVGPEVRRKILAILRENLAPQGVGFVSYNALPGWHLRRVVRDLLLDQTAGIDDPAEAIAKARSVLAVAAGAHPGKDPFGELMRDEYFVLSRLPDGYLYHEMLEEHNEAFYLHEFTAQVEAAGLQYLGPADFPEAFASDLPGDVRASLDGLPWPVREQYLDRLRGAAFKNSLVCRADVVVDRQLTAAVLERFSLRMAVDATLRVSADESPGDVAGPNPGLEVGRLTIGSSELVCSDRVTLAALRYLQEVRPETVAVPTLRRHAFGQVSRDARAAGFAAGTAYGTDEGENRLMCILLASLMTGAIEATISAPPVTSRISERPAVSPLARFEARRRYTVTNQTQNPVRLTNVSRFLAGLLDGTRDRRELIELLSRELESGRVSRELFETAEDARGLVDEALVRFRRAGLLVT
jgi:SAM-dependent methyltransferase